MDASPPGLEVQGRDVDRVSAGQQGIVSLGVGQDAEHVPRQHHPGGIVRVVAEDAGQGHPLDGRQLRGAEHVGVGVEEAVARLEPLKLVPDDAVRSGAQQRPDHRPLHVLGGDSTEKNWLEFWLEKPLEFWLEISLH